MALYLKTIISDDITASTAVIEIGPRQSSGMFLELKE